MILVADKTRQTKMRLKILVNMKFVVILMTTLLTALQQPNMLVAQPIQPQNHNNTNIIATIASETHMSMGSVTISSVKSESRFPLASTKLMSTSTSTSTSTPAQVHPLLLLSLANATAAATVTARNVGGSITYKDIAMQIWPVTFPSFSSLTDQRQQIATGTANVIMKQVQNSKNNTLSRSASRNRNSGMLINPETATTTTTIATSDDGSNDSLQYLPEHNDGQQQQQQRLDFNASQDDEALITFYQYCLSHRNSLADLLTLVLYAIVCMVGLLGNTLVIYVVLRFSKMQTVTNIYILNLAIADECFLIGIPFLLYTMRICSWEFGEWACKAYMVSTSITQFTSSIFLLIMSADRYLAVCHPIVSPRYRTLSNAKWVSSVAWLSSAVLMLPVLLFANTVIQEDGQHVSCNIKWPDAYKRHSGTTFIIYTFALGFATPLCFIMSFYCLVIRKLRRVGPKQRSKEKRRSHRKVTRLVLTVITVYILCWLPHWISQVALITLNPAQHELSRLELLIFLLLGCLAYSNSAMNPLLYAFLSDNFRKSFSKAFVCMSGRDMNAELQAEPSVYTTKNATRKRSTRLPLATTAKSNIMALDGANKPTPPNIKLPSAAACGSDSGSGGGNQTNTTNSSSAVSSTLTNTGGCSLPRNSNSGNAVNPMSNETNGAQEEALLQTDL